MRVLVCGGRTYHHQRYLFGVLDELHAKNPITMVINGGARGADELASQWAEERDVPYHEYLADWGKWGRSAGHIRNTWMLDDGKPELVVAFAGGRGTANMIRQAEERGIQVVEVP